MCAEVCGTEEKSEQDLSILKLSLLGFWGSQTVLKLVQRAIVSHFFLWRYNLLCFVIVGLVWFCSFPISLMLL